MANQVSFSLYEASKVTDVPESIIREAIKRGELPAAKIGRRLVVRREALDTWLQRYERHLHENA